MAKYPKLRLEEHLPSAELQQRYRAARDAAEARRWQALWLFSQDQPIGAVATIVGLHRNSVRALIKRYNANGPQAVSDQRAHNPGSRQPYLSAEQEDALRAALASPHPDGGKWNGARVARWIAQTTGRKQVYRQFGWAVLRRLGLTPQVPRPRHRQAATPEQQAEWKKN
jgi:transposase